MNVLRELFSQIVLWDLVDIAIVSALIYFILVLFKETKAVFVAFGMFILAGVYILARALNLVLTAYIFQGFFAVFLIALIVIFQEELRHFFERIAVWSLGGKIPSPIQSLELDILQRALSDLSRQRWGALIVLRGLDPIERHLTGGVELDGQVSEALLKSIFDPHSAGHDGALVIERNRVKSFAAHLPLSKDFEKTSGVGTRHAAALGLSELCDAMCLVVSEERGTISIAHKGALREVPDLWTLQNALDRFLRETSPNSVERRFLDHFRVNLGEKAAAFGLSVALWFLMAEGSQVARRTYEIAVSARNVPAELRVSEIQPPRVRAVLTGLRRDFLLMDSNRLKITLDLSASGAGEREFLLTKDSMGALPADVALVRFEPASVKVDLARALRGSREK